MSVDPSDTNAERQHANPTHEQLTSIEAILADSELTPPRKLDMLTTWDDLHGIANRTGHGRVAGAADLGFPDPSPYSGEVQRAIVELYRLHRKDLPPPENEPWTAD